MVSESEIKDALEQLEDEVQDDIESALRSGVPAAQVEEAVKRALSAAQLHVVYFPR